MDSTIAVIEDDKNLQTFLREYLNENGYLVFAASDGAEGLKMVEKHNPDLVLLDLELPTLKGDAVCIQLRKDYPNLPIIILTARDESSQIVQGLNLGANDYMTKPFNSAELLARIQAALRQNNQTNSVIQVADLILDPHSVKVTRAGKNIVLTPQEFKLLSYLMSNKGRVLTREMILSRLWSTNPDVETRVVDVYVGYLRKKIDSEYEHQLIHSVRGFGYKVDDLA